MSDEATPRDATRHEPDGAEERAVPPPEAGAAPVEDDDGAREPHADPVPDEVVEPDRATTEEPGEVPAAEGPDALAVPATEPPPEPELVPEPPREPEPEPEPERDPEPDPEPEPEPAPEPVGEPEPGSRQPDQPEPDQPEPPPGQLLPGDPAPTELPPRAVARGRLGQAWRPRASRAQLLAGVLCALLGFALVVQARQTQTQGLDPTRQSDLVALLDNVTNAEARAEQDVRDEQAIRDRLLSGTDSSAAAQEAARQRLDTLGILSGTVPASGPGIQLEISDPRRQVDSSILLDTLEELRDGGAEVVQIGDVRVVAATAFTDDSDGVRVDQRLLTPPYVFKVIGDPQTLSRLLQIPGGVLDVLGSKGAQGKVTQPAVVTVDALRPAAKPQYARPAQGATP